MKIDLTGQRFGCLIVVAECGKDNTGKNTLWQCSCDCGGSTKTTTTHLRSGHTQSCGCVKHEKLIEYGKNTRFKTKHNLSFTRQYRIWSGIKNRCTNPNEPKFNLYGGRGIKVCEEWLNDFIAFYDWAMANGYADDLRIDRIDCDGNYEPNNCRWVTYTDQNRNRRFCKNKVGAAG